MSDESADYIDFKVSDWELVPKSKINEPKLIALVENASLEATSADGNKRIVHFKRGAVIKVIKDPSGGSPFGILQMYYLTHPQDKTKIDSLNFLDFDYSNFTKEFL